MNLISNCCYRHIKCRYSLQRPVSRPPIELADFNVPPLFLLDAVRSSIYANSRQFATMPAIELTHKERCGIRTTTIDCNFHVFTKAGLLKFANLLLTAEPPKGRKLQIENLNVYLAQAAKGERR